VVDQREAARLETNAEAQIQVERKSSAELLDELYNKLMELKVDGYLSDLPLKQLPAPENDDE
jgi:hypothetical protein